MIGSSSNTSRPLANDSDASWLSAINLVLLQPLRPTRLNISKNNRYPMRLRRAGNAEDDSPWGQGRCAQGPDGYCPTSKQLLAKSGVGLGSTEYVVSKLTDSGLTSTEGCVQGSDVIRRHTVPAISNINGLCASDHVTEHQHH